MGSLTVGLVAICRVKFAGETRNPVASLYPTAEEARITCAIVDAAAKVRDLHRRHCRPSSRRLLCQHESQLQRLF